MSTTVIINPKTGLGKPENPYPWLIKPYEGNNFTYQQNMKWQQFNDNNPNLPIITAGGETLTDGRYECEKVCQWQSIYGKWGFIDEDEKFTFQDYKANNFATREVYRVIETPELPGKETTLDQHIAEMHILMEVKETVDEAAINELLKSPNTKKVLPDNIFIHGAIFGANWQKENSIDRDKVIAAIESSQKNNLEYHAVKALTNLLHVIKQMK